MPQNMCGKLIKKDLRGPWGFFDKGDSFRDALDSLLCREGGDFQNAKFTEDTEIVIERTTPNISGKYQIHVRTRKISELKNCADLVNKHRFVVDFLGE